ncbi:MAG TPA: hypothetical protein VFZ21_31130 [Gemmatimonadaceae bacterium]|jgi:hypothetical protein|nr:hypothetical protein [Gemmatimonadaceae bacterium]
MKRGTLIALAVAAAFGAFLLWSTLSTQRVECEACVEFNGRRNCAVASGPSEKEALQTAHMTACGPVTSGMNESIACQNRPAVVQRCRTR